MAKLITIKEITGYTEEDLGKLKSILVQLEKIDVELNKFNMKIDVVKV